MYEVDEDLLDGVGLTKEEIEVRRRRMQEESDLKVAMETFGKLFAFLIAYYFLFLQLAKKGS